jgi:cytochrome c6
MMKQALGIAVAVVGLGSILGTVAPATAADGAALWEKNCVACHGTDGKGDTKAGKLVKVPDLTAPDMKAKLTHDTVHQTIEQGVVDKATGKARMKGYKDKFSAEEIDALTAHVLGLVGAK